MDVVYRYDLFEPLVHQPIATADEGLARLERGHNRYASIVKQLHREMLGGPAPQQIVIPSNPLSLSLPLLAGKVMAQTPFAIVLGCSDARVPIELIFDQSPNDLFVVRVAGNVLASNASAVSIMPWPTLARASSSWWCSATVCAAP